MPDIKAIWLKQVDEMITVAILVDGHWLNVIQERAGHGLSHCLHELGLIHEAKKNSMGSGEAEKESQYACQDKA